jgi:ParB family chromosome partitioning protein
MKNLSLGKGLSALLKEEMVSITKDELVKIMDIDIVYPCAYQPRKQFEHDKLKELAESISVHGLLQPIIVNYKDDNKYIIIAGERRWRACKLIGLKEIYVIIKHLSEVEIFSIALIENIQRENLSPIEEAEGFLRLIDEFSYSQNQIAEIVGKSRAHVTNLLRLNQLPLSIKNMINENQLSMGHARCLIGNNDAQKIADHIITCGLNVRQTEHLVKNWEKNSNNKSLTKDKKSRINIKQSDSELYALAESLSEKFNIKITITKDNDGGQLTFHYNDLEQLDAILMRLN